MLNPSVWVHIQSLGCDFFFQQTQKRCITLDIATWNTFIYVALKNIVYFTVSDQILPEICKIKRLNGRFELK